MLISAPGHLLKLLINWTFISWPRFVSAGSQGGVDGSVASDHVVTEDVRAVDRHHQLGPAVGAGGLQGDVQREIPHQPTWGIQTLPALWIFLLDKIYKFLKVYE